MIAPATRMLPRRAVTASTRRRLADTHSRRRYSSVFGYTMAKCLVYGEYGDPSKVLRFHSYSIPPAYGDEVTVKFLAAPINPADINQIEGVYPSKPPFTTALGANPPCAVAGNEGVVEVLSCGSKVSSLKPGDRAVMAATGFGTWRTHATAKPSDLIRIRNWDGVSAVQAATVSVNPCTAYRMLKGFTDLRPGDWFIQNGANSGVGRSAIQFGRSWGLKSINVVRDRPDLGQLKADLEGLGASLVVTEDELAQKDTRKRILEACKGSLPKLGLNCVGGQSATNLVKQLAHDAHFVTYGAMSKKPLTFAAGSFIFNNLHAHGFWVSAWSDANPEEKRKMLDEIFDMMRSGEFVEAPAEVTEWKEDTELSSLLDVVGRGISGYAGKKNVLFMT